MSFRDETGKPLRIGVYVCHCGSNIAGVVSPAVRGHRSGEVEPNSPLFVPGLGWRAMPGGPWTTLQGSPGVSAQ